MEHFCSQVSGWLKSNSDSLLDTLPQGSGICRVVPVKPEAYWTGYVSTGQGSFKRGGDEGNWYGTSFDVSLAEVNTKETPLYEYSRLRQDTPVLNMHRLPEPFLTEIYNDRNLQSGQFFKSQFVVECLQVLGQSDNASGVYFPSRRAPGGVVVLNPQTVSIEIVSTGHSQPGGCISMPSAP